jgi:hypothetical protein
MAWLLPARWNYPGEECGERGCDGRSSLRSGVGARQFYADLLGLPEPVSGLGWFMVVQLANGVSLDFIDDARPERIDPQHYAFLVSDEEFDQIFARINVPSLKLRIARSTCSATARGYTLPSGE